MWLPERSDWVTPKERQLAKIAVLIEAGHDAKKIARKLGIPVRTIERRIAYLLSVQPDADRNGGQAKETGALVEGGADLATPAMQPSNAKEKTMPKSKITPFEPISIEVTVRQRPDGRIVVGYAGDDDRTPAIGEFVLDAITAALDAV
jgi:hypothetical protein